MVWEHNLHRVVYTVQGGKLQLSRKVKFRPHCFHECLHTTALFLKSTRSLRASTMDRSAAPPCSTTVSCQSVREEGAGAAMGFQKKPAKYLPRVLTDFTKYAFQPSLVTSDRDRYCKNLFPLWVFPTPWVVPLQSRHEVSGQERSVASRLSRNRSLQGRRRTRREGREKIASRCRRNERGNKKPVRERLVEYLREEVVRSSISA